MGSDSRERMLDSATHLLGRRGLHGTSFRDVIEHSGAPRGSIYHHFPGGKSQLVADAVRRIGAVGANERFEPDLGPVELLWKVIESWASLLRESDFRAGCPVMGVIADGFDDDDELNSTVGEFFAMTEKAVAYGLRQLGVEQGRARRAASLLNSAIEGAVMLCRAHRSMDVLDDVGVELEDYLRRLLADTAPTGGQAD